MVSALACSNAAASASSLPPLLAVGFVSGAVSVTDPRTAEVLLSLEGGHADAATALAWSPCGWYLFSAARRDGAVRCWDVRRADSVLPSSSANAFGCALSLSRASSSTQQRIALAVEPSSGRHLLSGGEDGWVRAFDLRAASATAAAASATVATTAAAPCPPTPPPPPPPPPSPPSSTGWRVSRETVAAVAIHPWLPLVAAGSGCRRIRGGGGKSGSSDSDGNKDDETTALPRAALSFWRPGYTWHEIEPPVA